MWVEFTNRDSAGEPVTNRLTVEYDGERVEIDVASTGTANVPEGLAEQMIESDDYAVEPADAPDSESDPDSDSDSDSDSDAESDADGS